ncbi:TPA: hypothetical protein ACJEU7_003356 [Acinetobacter baumannii]|uniref:hypothetical protein n=1 Tax=Acinetobacter baumannii TaxID=470 RepID=UPI00224D43E4|nr:hypothetical protein [Acinetobacter baumannii]MCX3034172.1 hypothetical protein [Acinetobacter baumannii]
MKAINLDQIFNDDKAATIEIIKKAEQLAIKNSVDVNKIFLGIGHIGKPYDKNTFFYLCDHESGELLKCYKGDKLERHRNRNLDSTYIPKSYNHWISYSEFKKICFAWLNGVAS